MSDNDMYGMAGQTKSEREARSYFSQGCAAGIGAACDHLLALSDGPASAEQAAAACEQGRSAFACLRSAQLLLDRGPDRRRAKAALRDLERCKTLREADPWHGTRFHFTTTAHVLSQYRRLRVGDQCYGQIHRAKCEAGESSPYTNHCYNWADKLRDQPDDALRYYELGCKQGYPSACTSAATLLESGKIERSGAEEAATQHRARACELSAAKRKGSELLWMCHSAATRLLDGKGRRDRKRAVKLARHNCSDGSLSRYRRHQRDLAIAKQQGRTVISADTKSRREMMTHCKLLDEALQ